MVYRYVPILRFKAGERVALEKLSPGARNDVIPLMLLAPEQFVGKKATKAAPAIPNAAYFVQQMSYAVGASPFYLDCAALPVGPAGHPLTVIAGQARAANLSLVPATTLAAPATYQAAVAAAVAADGRGVALRIDLNELAQSAAWAPTWGFPFPDTDLIIDLGGTLTAAHALGAGLHPTFQGLANGGLWRSVTVAGSSMPSNFQGVAAGLFPLPRVEVNLWNNVKAVTPYRLDFGDYGTVSLTPPPQGIAWGYPITVKYTLGTHYLICRGVRTKGAGALDMDVQLRGHAQGIRNHPGRNPLGHCWGDTTIDAIAANGAGTGGLAQWVSYSVNRHIENTRAVIP